MGFRLLFLVFCASLLVLGPVAAQEGGLLYALDAQNSRLFSLDPSSGVPSEPFATPVLCQPEGACGLAYDGHSLFYVDSTDPAQRIYELNPRDGTIWNSLPAPTAAVDALAWDGGWLFALSFLDSRVYRLDPFDGRIDGSLQIDEFVIGGLAAANGRLFASSVLSAEIFEIDPQSGEILNRFVTESAFPSGLTLLEGRLYASDFEAGRILVLDPEGGSQELDPIAVDGQVAALASGPVPVEPTYGLAVEVGDQVLLDDGRIEFLLTMTVSDGEGRVFAANDHSPIELAVVQGEAEIVGRGPKVTRGGVAEARVRLASGQRAQVEARLSGLETQLVALGGIAPAAGLNLVMTPTADDPGLIEVRAELVDANGEIAAEDTSRVRFALVRGRGAVVGLASVAPTAGVARSFVRLAAPRTTLELEARVRRTLQKGVFEAGAAARQAPSGGGLTLSAGPVAGGDEKPPAPPTGVRATRQDSRVQVEWELSADDGLLRWSIVNGRNVPQALVQGYRVYRRQNDGLFVQVARLPAATAAWEDEIATEPATYRYKVVADDGANLSEPFIALGSDADLARTVRRGAGVPVDENGQQVQGLFADDNLTVDFDDFFIFADNFGRVQGGEGFDARFDLDGDGAVDFNDFFIFADNFGRTAVRID